MNSKAETFDTSTSLKTKGEIKRIEIYRGRKFKKKYYVTCKFDIN